jgi:hypothetical protein
VDVGIVFAAGGENFEKQSHANKSKNSLTQRRKRAKNKMVLPLKSMKFIDSVYSEIEPIIRQYLMMHEIYFQFLSFPTSCLCGDVQGCTNAA